MAETVGQHSVAAFTSPVNGTSPIDANTVKGNDNTIRSAYVDHDADPGIHVQSSTLASRPTANSAGRKWMTADSGVIRLFYDDGTNWYEADYLRTTGGTISGNLAVTGTLGVTGVTTLTAQPILSSLTASQAVFTDASKGLVSNAITGTGNVVMSASPTLTGTIQAAAANLSGALGVSGLLTFASLKGTGATTVTNILDEDNMASDSATALATQQSIKAYVDAQVGASDALSEVLAIGNTTGANDIIVSTGQKIRTPAVAAGDGSAAITIANTTGALTFATALADSNLATISTAGKVANSATTATDANTASAIVARDASGNFSAGTITAALTGNASTATALQTARTINGTSFDGTANITVTAAAGTLTGTTLASNVVSSSLTSVGTLANLTVTNPISGSVTGSSGSTTGNAATATALQTARNINGVSFNGTADITVTAAAGTLTGTTLASGVTASSLTSVGTLTSLTVSGNLTVDTNTLFVDAANNRVGIGLTNPGTALDITGASGTTAATVRLINSGTAAGDYAIYQLKQGTGSTWQMFTGANSDTLTFGRSGVADYLYLTNSGNLGLGVTPSAWGTTNSIRALQLNSGALWNFSTGGLNLIQNGYYDGSNYKYVATAAASQYSQSSGAHSWSIAASGTAGNNISFTQAMTLDASGNLFVGTTTAQNSANVQISVGSGASSSPRLSVFNTATSPTSSASSAVSLGFVNGSANYVATNTILGAVNFLGQANDDAYGGASIQALVTSGGNVGRGSGHSVDMIFNTKPSTGTGVTERARITSGGSFLMAANSVIGLNTSDGSDNGYLALVGAGADGENRGGGIYLHGNERSSEAGAVVLQAGNVATTGIVSFRTGAGTERARITSGGYFKASNDGTYLSATGSYHEFRSSINNGTLIVTNTNGSYTDDLIYGTTTTAAGTGFKLIRLDANSVEQFRVRGDGTIFAQNTTVQSLSDVRLKENISDAAEGLAVITALRPVRYDWKAGYGNDRKNQLGFVAQEMEAVFPEAVSVWEMDEPTGEVDEDGKPITEKVDYKTVGPGALIPVLVKAIQELEARIAVLEAGA